MQADSSLLEQQQVFEGALTHNNATHEARLRRVQREEEERAARQSETATIAVASASAAALRAQGRQAGAAVAAIAAAGVQAQAQQASAMAAQAAMFLEFQVCSCSPRLVFSETRYMCTVLVWKMRPEVFQSKSHQNGLW